MTQIYLKPKKEESLLRQHPWVFSGAIHHIDGAVQEGQVVQVLASDGTLLGVGHYQIGSIAVRILSFEDEQIDASFWSARISEAYRMRRQIGLIRTDNDTYRLIHGEGDFLPGLVVDVYADTAVIQAHSVGMHLVRHTIAQTIIECVPEVHNIYYKSDGTLPHKAPIDDRTDQYLIGQPTSCLATENGLKFHIDWLRGQKTGFFVDQRENRSLLEHYAAGRDVLNMFCYTGGFSVYALRGGARLVHSVDSSAKAVEYVHRNVMLNFGNDAPHEAFAQDAFDFLSDIKNKYDLIILDPPAFAKHRDAVRNALQGYKRLNARAFEQIRPGGVLFTFSCSQAVDREMFRLAVFSAASMSGRRVRILHQLTQPQDHPVNIYHPEGEYLKGLVLQVE
ncbi:MAG: class I SAM-dependent rRNA methyltransferase [Paludibacteraceae bacterium]|nr:class I SAM-dependent rRNA methyltransferase [Paludibacteraceae bacterium]